MFRSLRYRRALICMLIVAMTICGVSGQIAALLGPNHVHSTARHSDPMAGWQDFRRVAGPRMVPVHVHAHDGLQRHHHGAGDGTVVTFESTASADATGGSDGSRLSSASVLVLAIASIVGAPIVSSHAERWAPTQALLRVGRVVAPPERPPRA